MQPSFRIAANALAAMLAAGARPAEACIMRSETTLDDVRSADLVVVGKISNYEIVLNQEIRRKRKEQLADPNLPLSIRQILRSRIAS
jgi:hypothetical protein